VLLVTGQFDLTLPMYEERDSSQGELIARHTAMSGDDGVLDGSTSTIHLKCMQ
jgi:hypothetical protein